jgi:hypothetical protein
MEQQAGVGVFRKLGALAAVEIGVEYETACIMTLEQHHPHRRPPVRAGSRKRHCIRIVRLASPGLGVPRIEQSERIVGHGLCIYAPPPIRATGLLVEDSCG